MVHLGISHDDIENTAVRNAGETALYIGVSRRMGWGSIRLGRRRIAVAAEGCKCRVYRKGWCRPCGECKKSKKSME